MTPMAKRVAKVEKAMGGAGLDEYRRTVECLLEIGAIDPPEDGDVEGLVQEYAARGWTLKVILKEIEGTTRGLPDGAAERAELEAMDRS